MPWARSPTWIVGASGAAIGQATFTETRAGVLIRLEFLADTLPPGGHAVHIHQIGDCSDFAAGFMAAGIHEGLVAEVQHGLLNHAGPDAGDLPNLFTPAASTPSGAPPEPMYMSIPVLAASAQWMTPAPPSPNSANQSR